MKKLLFAAFAVLGLVACTQKQTGYTIVGTVDSKEVDINKNVVLREMDYRKITILDTAKITDGSFEFKGVQDTAKMVLLVAQNAEKGKRHKMTPFFLENGTITVKIGKKIEVTGTKLNDLLTTYTKTTDSIYSSFKVKSYEEHKVALVAVNKYVAEFLPANLDNLVGMYILNQKYSKMEMADLESLLTKVPAEMAKEEAVVKAKAFLATSKKTAIGQPFTDMTMKDPEGKDIKLSDYVGKGKYVLVDFWASWCGPCRGEMPNVVEAYKKYKTKGLEIVGVSFDSKKEAWVKSIKDLNMTWPQMSDLKGWECIGSKLYNVRGIPATYLFDKEGKIIAKNLRGKDLDDKLKELLDK